MGEETGIAWTDHTFNPWIGCTKVSAGCENCYAERENQRFNWNPDGWGQGKPRRLTSDTNWKKPLQWARQAVKDGVIRRVFCASLAAAEWRNELWELIYETGKIGGLEWLILTKRPFFIELALLKLGWIENPPDYIRIGVTAEDQPNADRRISDLLQFWKGKNFVSVEPMLGPVDLKLGRDPISKYEIHVNLIDWVICGSESGPYKRPFNLDWARSLRDQCVDAGVPFFLKQMPVDGRLVKMPELDGRPWAEYPK